MRSAGLQIASLGAPQLVTDALLSECRELVRLFNDFYRAVIDAYYQGSAPTSEFLLSPEYASCIEAERAEPSALPFSRFDCVLTEDGSLQVIELNPNGVCLAHLRTALYLARALKKSGDLDEAERLARLGDELVDAFDRSYRARCPEARCNPTVGSIHPGLSLLSENLLFRAAFERKGWSFVFGHADELEVLPTGIKLRGQDLDILWADNLFYFAYQSSRYRETSWPNKFGDYGAAPAIARELLSNPLFCKHVRTGRVVLLSPMKAFLALPKSLLAWVHRDPSPIPAEQRLALRSRVARTYARRERQEGAIGYEDAVKAKDHLLLKPSQYGGAHGVLAGRETPVERWQQKLDEVWESDGWVLQDFLIPIRTSSGEYVSVGLYNYDGRLGGVILRTADSLVISARNSGFIAATPADW